jgi:transposase
MKHGVIAIDVAKRAFQRHGVDPQTGEVERVKLRRDKVSPFLPSAALALVAMEAGGSAHWWGRELRALGHEMKLPAPRSVRPFVRSNKTDAADARAIWTAVQPPEARLVAV